ncbi:MAG: hypothetical protein HY336_01320 [Candidatus Doudnabacteria bacterium]|nr:hypothetical protein [Candidatus Doudnabacteria bacterium]
MPIPNQNPSIKKFFILGTLCLGVLFLSPQKSSAALTLPVTSCDQQLANMPKIKADMQQEDGAKSFTYGPDNNSFVSLSGDVVTFNISVLFDPMVSPNRVIRFNAFNANCSGVYGNAFINFLTSNNTIAYNKATTGLKFNQEDEYMPTMMGLPRYIWLEVWDGKNDGIFASYSYLVDLNEPANPTGTTVEEEPIPQPEPDAEPEEQPQEPQEPSGKRPVLIIPGIMGSELYEGNEKVWERKGKIALHYKDQYLIDKLLLEERGRSVKTIVPNEVIKKVLTVDTFDGLTKYFEANGYEEEGSLFFLPYDWRLNLDDNINLLKEKIDTIKLSTRFIKLDFIVHSMGGLLIEDYLNKEGLESINKLIFVGTPQLGSPKSVKVLLTGDTGLTKYLLSHETIKELGRNMTSVYQLLPNPRYFQIFDHYLNLMNRDLRTYENTKFFLSEELNSYLLDQADLFFQKELYNSNFGDAGIYNIIGCGLSTQASYRYDSENKNINRIGYTTGDGTVPMISAQYLNIPLENKFYVNKVDHAELPSDQKVRELILNLLNGNSSFDPSKISTSSIFCGFKGKQFSWRSPVTIHIYDQNGNHAGPTDDGGFENNLIGVDYEIIGGEKFIFIPTDDGNTYTIQATGDEVGTFDLVMSDIDNGEATGSTVYNDVPITGSSQINVDISGIISLDFAGDGSFETLEPSSSLTGDAVDDLTAPETVYTIDGDKGVNGNYINSATITLQATDDSSGILETKYSIDNSAYEVYTGPVILNENGAHSFSFYSVDKAGNNETVQQIQGIIIEPDLSNSIGGGSYATDPGQQQREGQVLGEKTEKKIEEKEKLKDGTLVLDSTDGRTVYMIGTGGKKYGFTSQEIFWGLGYSFENLVTEDVSNYELGGLVDTVERAHPDGSLVVDKDGVVWFINFGHRALVDRKDFLSFNNKQLVIINNHDLKLITL